MVLVLVLVFQVGVHELLEKLFVGGWSRGLSRDGSLSLEDRRRKNASIATFSGSS